MQLQADMTHKLIFSSFALFSFQCSATTKEPGHILMAKFISQGRTTQTVALPAEVFRAVGHQIAAPAVGHSPHLALTV